MVRDIFRAVKKRLERRGYDYCLYNSKLNLDIGKATFNLIALKKEEGGKFKIILAKVVKIPRKVFISRVLNEKMRNIIKRLKGFNVDFEIYIFSKEENYKYYFNNGKWELNNF